MVPLKHRIESGIEYGGFPGIVSRFHEMAACNIANYQFYGNWQELSREQRAEVLAQYFLGFLIDGHKHEALRDKIDKDSRRNKNKRNRG